MYYNILLHIYITMPKILTTNLMALNWATQPNAYFPDGSNKILSIPKVVQYSVVQYDDWQWPLSFSIRTNWYTKYMQSYDISSFIPDLPNQYNSWYLSNTNYSTDQTTWALEIDAIYSYNNAPSWFVDYYEMSDFNSRFWQVFESIASSLWFDSNHWYSVSTYLSWWIRDSNYKMITVSSMYYTSDRRMAPTFIVYIINNPWGTQVDDYFVADMTNSCEYTTSPYALSNIRMNTSSFDQFFTHQLSQSCWITIDGLVADLYRNKI